MALRINGSRSAMSLGFLSLQRYWRQLVLLNSLALSRFAGDRVLTHSSPRPHHRRTESSIMTPSIRKLLLTAHITLSVGWFGAVAAFLVLAIAGLTSRDAEMVRTAYAAMELTARFVIVPLAFASLLSGIVQSLGTPWGLFRHYWVLVKLLLTTFATIVLLAKMPLIGYAARRAAETTSSSVDLHTVGIQLAVHATGGMLVLLVITALSVYKPWGLTRYGQRKQQERRDEPRRSLPAVVGIKAMSGRDKEIIGDGLSRALRVSLAAGVGALVVAVHISMYVTGHGFHHGH
jgi:hypothetical protein